MTFKFLFLSIQHITCTKNLQHDNYRHGLTQQAMFLWVVQSDATIDRSHGAFHLGEKPQLLTEGHALKLDLNLPVLDVLKPQGNLLLHLTIDDRDDTVLD